jgi:hypothetical protein
MHVNEKLCDAVEKKYNSGKENLQWEMNLSQAANNLLVCTLVGV